MPFDDHHEFAKLTGRSIPRTLRVIHIWGFHFFNGTLLQEVNDTANCNVIEILSFVIFLIQDQML